MFVPFALDAMKLKPCSVGMLALLGACALGIGALAQNTVSRVYNPEVAIYFSPKGGAQDAIRREIDGAKVSIRVQAFSFTSIPIVNALQRAHERKVEVFVLLDKSQLRGKYSGATYLADGGIPTGIDDRHSIAHNKILIIDREVVITGSFNLSKQAEEKNAEKLLVMRDKDLAATYGANWEAHAAHAFKIEPSAAPPAPAPPAPTLAR